MTVKMRLQNLERKTAPTAGPVTVKAYSARCSPDSWGGTSDPATAGYIVLPDDDPAFCEMYTTRNGDQEGDSPCIHGENGAADSTNVHIRTGDQEASHAND
jgi:hypothetical protein